MMRCTQGGFKSLIIVLPTGITQGVVPLPTLLHTITEKQCGEHTAEAVAVCLAVPGDEEVAVEYP